MRKIHPRGKVASRLFVAAVATGTAAALLTACSGTEAGALDGQHGDEVTIVQPGKPGEAASTISPDDVPEEPTWNHTDIAFMQMMIPHHDQALEMSRLAETRTESKAVRSLAARIKAAQGPEIMSMAAWLDQRGLEVPRHGDGAGDFDHSQHGHDEMTGMLTPDEMAELADARGTRFDRLFLRGMIAHHRGALTMASRASQEGTDLRVSELAADVSASQSAEIQRMRELLRSLDV